MTTFLRPGLLASLCFLCLCGGSSAATPRDELLRLAPADPGFCLVVQGLRDQAVRVERSPFTARLAASPYGQAVRASPEARKLAKLDEQLRTHLNVSWAQLRDDVLGDA